MECPDWWAWELEISGHCLKRMQERGFNETDLRTMLADATRIIEQAHGPFLVETVHENHPWEMIVSPDDEHQLLVVVSAYPDF